MWSGWFRQWGEAGNLATLGRGSLQWDLWGFLSEGGDLGRSNGAPVWKYPTVATPEAWISPPTTRLNLKWASDKTEKSNQVDLKETISVIVWKQHLSTKTIIKERKRFFFKKRVNECYDKLVRNRMTRMKRVIATVACDFLQRSHIIFLVDFTILAEHRSATVCIGSGEKIYILYYYILWFLLSAF